MSQLPPSRITVVVCAPLNLLESSSDRCIQQARAIGIPRIEAIRTYREAYRTGYTTAKWAEISPAPIDARTDGESAVKFTQRLAAQAENTPLETESVILAMRQRTGRTTYTLCVSSQVGCAMGCTFCETAQMGLMKNLSVGEIVGQWWAARHVENVRIRNVVFMGMGEPMDNLDAVLGAIEILCDRNGPAVAPTHVSVSTVGRIEGIARYTRFAARDGWRKLKLAVSVNAPDDAVRSSIMPINRAAPMSELRAAIVDWTKHCSPALIEYVLIPGVNDRMRDADLLCAWLGDLPSTVNLIPYNPRRDSPWPAPDETSIARFAERIASHGRFVKQRRTLGRGLMAACGQLGNPGIRRRRFLSLAPDNAAN